MVVDADMAAELGGCGLRFSVQHHHHVVRTCVAQALFQMLGSTNTAVNIGLAFRQFMALGQHGEGNGQFYFMLANHRKHRMSGFCGIRLKLGCLEIGDVCRVQNGLLQTPAICVAAAVG